MSAPAMPHPLFEHDRTLKIALTISVALHVAVLLIRFVAPETFKLIANDPNIEIVLVNAKTESRPNNAEVLAQVSMDAGGDRDTGRASSPLPPEEDSEPGDALKSVQKRVETLEEQQRRLMSQMREQKQRVHELLDHKPDKSIDPQMTGTELLESSKAMVKQFAVIDKQVEDYNKRPRKGVYGINAKGHSTALYVSAWQQKIEKIGSQNYPDAARGKFYGKLVLTVHLKPDGAVEAIDLDKSSGNDILDRAAVNIVKMGEPYARFTDEMRAEMDVLVLTRTWIFTNDSLQTK
ncbi:MAG: TonB family protein [Burkholderiaceae bacterium]|nr:MAG: TonB family protein [Burkholderiaceae bacterium]